MGEAILWNYHYELGYKKMRAIIQRVKQCSIDIDGKQSSSISKGMLILLGIHKQDKKEDAEYLAERCKNLRIFEDDGGKMNLSVSDIQGEVMVVSQFTVYGETLKGNRPNYSDAAPPNIAEILYEHFVNHLQNYLGKKRVATGTFRAMMDVKLINDGPVTLIVESKNHSQNL
jgi:D-tyrosyl-tRNA(Tyr) deacylase